MFLDLGLEPTPGEFIHNMVEIFREVRRVLRDDGVVWMNLGDCFAGSGGENANTGLQGGNTIKANSKDGTRSGLWRSNPRKTKIQQGNLMMMPHRVAIALQDDGWIVRNDVAWFKRNPMPESVNGWRFESKSCDCAKTKVRATSQYHQGAYQQDHGHSAQIGTRKEREDSLRNPGDPDCPNCNGSGKVGDPKLRKGSWRHTRAHEFIFQLTKQMKYWSNQEAVREAHTHPDAKFNTGDRTLVKELDRPYKLAISRPKNYVGNIGGRNPRSVLDVPTAPYKGAHYATFPPNLIAPLIRATCPRWVCPICGQGWSPVVNRGDVTGIPGQGGDGYQLAKAQSAQGESNIKGRSEGWIPNHFIPTNVVEYRPTCEHPHTIEEAVPGICLDPFIGSGTTGAVARELQRRWIGLDISMEYIDLQAKIRTKSGSPSNELDGLPLFDKELP